MATRKKADGVLRGPAFDKMMQMISRPKPKPKAKLEAKTKAKKKPAPRRLKKTYEDALVTFDKNGMLEIKQEALQKDVRNWMLRVHGTKLTKLRIKVTQRGAYAITSQGTLIMRAGDPPPVNDSMCPCDAPCP